LSPRSPNEPLEEGSRKGREVQSIYKNISSSGDHAPGSATDRQFKLRTKPQVLLSPHEYFSRL